MVNMLVPPTLVTLSNKFLYVIPHIGPPEVIPCPLPSAPAPHVRRSWAPVDYSARLNRIGPGIWSRAYIRKCRALRCVTLPHSPIFSCYNRASRQAARVHKKQPNHATVS